MKNIFLRLNKYKLHKKLIKNETNKYYNFNKYDTFYRFFS